MSALRLFILPMLGAASAANTFAVLLWPSWGFAGMLLAIAFPFWGALTVAFGRKS